MKFFIILGFFYTFPLKAFYRPTSQVLPLNERFNVIAIEEKLASEGIQKMIGHMTLASIAIDYKLKESALNHIETAKVEALMVLKDSQKGTQELKSLPFGKLTYDIGEENKEYYLPVWFGEGINGEVTDYSKGKGSKLEIKNSSIVHSTVRLNMKTTLDMLDRSKEALLKGNYGIAGLSIKTIFNDVLVSEEAVSDPILTVWSNMVLAREFMEMGEFTSARFTIRKAQQSLKELVKSKVLKKNSDESVALELELETLTKGLDEKSPGIILRAKNKTKEWVTKIKAWI